jgi:hypothetical protein
MSETANQPQTSDGVGTLEHQSFLGTEPELDLDAEESPETSASVDGEVSADAEGQEDAASEAEEPSVQERLKDLTQRESESYQQRYPNAWKRLNDPNVSADDKHLLLDKIESDKEIYRLRAQEEYWNSLEQEPTLEEEAEPEAPFVPPDPAAIRAAYYQRVDNLVKTYVDPQAINQLGADLLAHLGVDLSKVNDPNLQPQDRAELQALAANAPKLGGTLARAATDLIATVLPLLFQEAQEMTNPGWSRTYEKQMCADQWDQVRSQTGPDGRAVFANLPQYGTPQFKTALRAAAAQIPNFDNLVFTGRDGRALPMHEQTRMKYAVLAQRLNGERVPPAVVAQALQTGKRLASQADRKRVAGRALGAGQSTNRGFKSGTNADDDPVMAALDAELNRTNENIRPISRFATRSRT